MRLTLNDWILKEPRMKIAISGKGGVGKTTIVALLANELARQGQRVLAIDADPNSNLASALGYDFKKDGRIVPLIANKQLINDRTGAKPGSFGGYFLLDPKVDDLVEKFSVEINGIRLMVTGEIKKALSGCYCSENALLRSFLRHLMLMRQECVIVDMEAGIEHLTRGTAESVSVLLIVVEPGQRALATADRIADLGRQLNIKQIGYVINKVHTKQQVRLMIEHLGETDIWGVLPYDLKAVESDLIGTKLCEECPTMREVIQGLLDNIYIKYGAKV